MLRPKRLLLHEERDVEDMSQDEPTEKNAHNDDKHDQQAHDKTRSRHYHLSSMPK